MAEEKSPYVRACQGGPTRGEGGELKGARVLRRRDVGNVFSLPADGLQARRMSPAGQQGGVLHAGPRSARQALSVVACPILRKVGQPAAAASPAQRSYWLAHERGLEGVRWGCRVMAGAVLTVELSRLTPMISTTLESTRAAGAEQAQEVRGGSQPC